MSAESLLWKFIEDNGLSRAQHEELSAIIEEARKEGGNRRCRGFVKGIRCTLKAGHAGEHSGKKGD